MKYLVVIDAQNDFVDGSLGTPEAVLAMEKAAELIENFDGKVYCTMDTHYSDYLSTEEGKHIPVEHCIVGKRGRDIYERLYKVLKDKHPQYFQKDRFGCIPLVRALCADDTALMINENDKIESITIVGLVTDICVITNALLIKTFMPTVPITVVADCCAGTTPERHKKALDIMKNCLIEVA